MAVLVEGISVIVRANALGHYAGGLLAFKAAVPNQTFCADGELLRVGFMHPADVEDFVAQLERDGLVYLAGDASQDIVVADQLRGFAVPCDWAEFGRVDLGPGQRIAACRLLSSRNQQVVKPEGWTWDTSLSASLGFVPSGSEQSLTKISESDGIETYRSQLTADADHVGRTTKPKH